MFEFCGDYFNAACIAAILKYEDYMEILPYGVKSGEGVEYSFKPSELDSEHATAVKRWKAALCIETSDPQNKQ